MGDTRQTGGMEVRLTADTSEFVRAMQQAETRLKSLQAQAQAMPAVLKKWLDQETQLTNKIEEKRLRIMALDGALSAQADQYVALEKAMGRVGDLNLEDAFAEQRQAMEEAITQLDLLQTKLTQVQQTGGRWEVALDPQPQRAYAAAVDTTADSLSALSPVLGDSLSGIGGLASKIGSFIPVMNAAGAGGAAMGAAVLGGIGIALAGAGVLLNTIQKMEEEHRKTLQAAWDAMQESEEKARKLAVTLGLLDSQSASRSDISRARKDLAELFPQMVLGYDDEGNAILRNNEALAEQIGLLREKHKIEQERAVLLDDGEAIQQYREYAQQLNKLQSEYDRAFSSYKKDFKSSARTSRISDNELKLIFQDNGFDEWSAKINALKLTMMSYRDVAAESISADIERRIQVDGELSDKQLVVADNAIKQNMDTLLNTSHWEEYSARRYEVMASIRAILSDQEAFEKEYNSIVGTQAKDEAQQAAEHREQVGRVYKALVDEARGAAEQTYTDSVEAATAEVNATYEARKKGLQAETDAVQESLKAQQSAYQSLKFDVRTLDEQDLANKLDLLDRQLAAEKDAQVQAVMAVQQRYYEEARLIVETANKEIQVHRDKLTALDEADRQAEEARTARQNAAKLRDLNERYAKQQGENAREMAEKTKAYEEKRDALLAVIAAPPSRTAGILAQRELDDLNVQWTQEREGLELDHADKLLQIQRQLDEEKLTQQEAAEQAERQRERDRLNEQITDLQSHAEQQLIILSNRYTIEKELQQTALAEQLKAEQDNHQLRLDELNAWKDQELEARKQRAAAIRDTAVQEENLTAEAIRRIENASYQERLDMLEKYGIDAAQKAEAIKKHLIGIFDNDPSLREEERGHYSVDRNLRRGIPAFAQGGIVSQPTLAMVGEGGEPEAILPLSRLKALIGGMKNRQEADKERLLTNVYYTFLPIMARFGLSPDGSRTTTNNNQRTVTYNIEKVEINHPNDAQMATAQLESLCGGW